MTDIDHELVRLSSQLSHAEKEHQGLRVELSNLKDQMAELERRLGNTHRNVMFWQNKLLEYKA